MLRDCEREEKYHEKKEKKKKKRKYLLEYFTQKGNLNDKRFVSMIPQRASGSAYLSRQQNSNLVEVDPADPIVEYS